MGYPSFDEIVRGKDRDALLTIARSIRSVLSLVFNFFISLGFVYLIVYVYGVIEPWRFLPFMAYISPRWLGIVPLLFLLEIFRRRYDDLYVFGEHRITHQNGRLSLTLHRPNIKYLDIRVIDVSQSIVGRIFNYGTVALGTAAADDYEVILRGIYDPRAVVDIIETFRDYSTAFHLTESSARAVNDGE